MREFRNWDERNKSISDVKKKLSLMFGFHKDIFLSDLFRTNIPPSRAHL